MFFNVNTNMGLDFVSGQYGCLFSRCRKYVINSLIHGHFHIGLVIIPRPILDLDSVSGQYGGLGMITRPIWKCPCINLYIFDSNSSQNNIINVTLSNFQTQHILPLIYCILNNAIFLLQKYKRAYNLFTFREITISTVRR